MANTAPEMGRSGIVSAGLHASQVLALATGAAFTLVGIAGWAVTGTDDFAAAGTGDTLLGFELNPLHNIVHLILGVAGLLMWRTIGAARAYGTLLFAGYGLAFIYGLFVVNSTSAANFLSLNTADNGLHLVAALIGLAAMLIPSGETGRDFGSSRRSAM